jgi:hypothetical protein
MVAAAIKVARVAAVNWDKVIRVGTAVATMATAAVEIAKEIKKKGK